jgi:hypothetical protein
MQPQKDLSIFSSVSAKDKRDAIREANKEESEALRTEFEKLRQLGDIVGARQVYQRVRALNEELTASKKQLTANSS